VLTPKPALLSHTDKLFALTLDLMVIKDASTHLWTHVNPQVVRTLGYSVQELTSQSSMNFLHPEDRSETELKALNIASSGIIENFENRYMTCNGRIVWLSWTAVFEPSENLVYAVAKDITKSKEQEKVIAQQKMEMAVASKLNALGRFAAGIAHEVNNPLTIVYGQTCKLRKLMSKPEIQQEEVLKITEQIETMVARIVRIVNGLRAFTREGSVDAFELVSVKSIIEDTLAFCRGNFREHKIELLVDDVPDCLRIRARPVQISQVLLNLLNNAYDAVLEATEKWIRVSIEVSEATIEIRVIDSGMGVAPEKKSQLFKAFFTTKAIGSGTGLGLNIARMILGSHGGEVFLEDASPHTSFVVRLPQAR
jgi:PAS domain S-box-containing protein